MNDAEYIFKQTASERKRNGYGDYHKKRQGGRQVRLPSDHLSKKEREAMNGELLTYNMNAPVQWWRFRDWPDDIKTEYLQRLEEVYRASTLDISLMMHTSYDNIRLLKQRLGIASKRGGKRLGVDKIAWDEFCGVAPAPDLEPTLKSASEPMEEPAEKSPELPVCHGDCGSPTEEEAKKKIALGMDSVMNIAILLDKLRGTGAKLTIEVVL